MAKTNDHEITESQLIAALLEARAEAQNPDGAMTTQELMDRLGWSGGKVRRRLHALKAEGKLEVVQVTRKNLVDVDQVLPGYRILDTTAEPSPE